MVVVERMENQGVDGGRKGLNRGQEGSGGSHKRVWWVRGRPGLRGLRGRQERLGAQKALQRHVEIRQLLVLEPGGQNRSCVLLGEKGAGLAASARSGASAERQTIGSTEHRDVEGQRYGFQMESFADGSRCFAGL